MLTSISRRSHLNWIFQAMFAGEFTLCITTAILAEYAEIIERHMGAEVAENTLKAIMNLVNIERVDLYYRWNLIRDADDNKFVDCAIATNAKFIVSHDKHFNILSSIGFPIVKVISAEEFQHELSPS